MRHPALMMALLLAGAAGPGVPEARRRRRDDDDEGPSVEPGTYRLALGFDPPLGRTSRRKQRRCPACGRTGPLDWKLCVSALHPKRPVKTRQEWDR